MTKKNRLMVLSIGVFLICIAGLSYAQDDAETTPQNGQLIIKGKGIEHLVLLDTDNTSHEFKPPGEVISLPPGEYRPSIVTLKGGLSCVTYSFMEKNRVKIEAGKTTELNVGAPLAPAIKVTRSGNMLVLGYELRGIGGEQYNDQSRENAPGFVVYKGDKQVGSGKFEFG
jgi:hypothetical protein